MENQMKLSNETLSVLKNFAGINSGIEFKKGNVIRTMSSGKTVLAAATVKDEFPQDFCVYDLNQFLSVHSLNKDTEIDFDDVNVIFKSGSNGRNKIKYRKTEKNMIVTPPDKQLTLPSVDIAFTLTEEDFNSVLKTASVLQSPNIAIESTGDKILVTAYNPKDDAAHTNSVEVADGNGKTFKMVFLTENLKMISGTYDVEISAKGLSSFKNKNVDIQYWVATESKESKFEG
jgi:hypothetical protein